ncbi:MAG: hypothetical protein ABII82_19320 [Verrucomicrobiota bacterium]
MSDDNQPHATESIFTTTRDFTDRVIEEMPMRVIAAIAFVAFFFFYGAAINLIKLAGRDLATIDFPVGVVTGALGSLATTTYIIAIKVRQKRRTRRTQSESDV